MPRPPDPFCPACYGDGSSPGLRGRGPCHCTRSPGDHVRFVAMLAATVVFAAAGVLGWLPW